MKYVLVFLIALTSLLACSKDDNTQTINANTPATLQNVTWSLDSFVTITPNYTYTDVPAAG